MAEVVKEVVEERWVRHREPFGWSWSHYPTKVVLDCECGNSMVLTQSWTSCHICGAEYSALVKSELELHRLKNGEAHPWHEFEHVREGLPY